MRAAIVMNLLAFVVMIPNVGGVQDKPARHVEKDGGFSIELPPNWTAQEFGGLKFKILVGPVVNGFGSNMVFMDESSTSNLKDYVAASKKALQAVIKDIKEISETEMQTAEGAACVRLVFEAEHQGIRLRQTVYCLDLAPGKKLAITCSTLADGGDKLDAVFEASAKSLRIEKK
ncbi:MAG TPA: hypothetical protein VE988_10650 [Gemmataceae bacterium]|nr:hypothetical protein [Gemmataceae bacterium]